MDINSVWVFTPWSAAPCSLPGNAGRTNHRHKPKPAGVVLMGHSCAHHPTRGTLASSGQHLRCYKGWGGRGCGLAPAASLGAGVCAGAQFWCERGQFVPPVQSQPHAGCGVKPGQRWSPRLLQPGHPTRPAAAAPGTQVSRALGRASRVGTEAPFLCFMWFLQTEGRCVPPVGLWRCV